MRYSPLYLWIIGSVGLEPAPPVGARPADSANATQRRVTSRAVAAVVKRFPGRHIDLNTSKQGARGSRPSHHELLSQAPYLLASRQTRAARHRASAVTAYRPSCVSWNLPRRRPQAITPRDRFVWVGRCAGDQSLWVGRGPREDTPSTITTGGCRKGGEGGAHRRPYKCTVALPRRPPGTLRW
jgi:hypothetical protein